MKNAALVLLILISQAVSGQTYHPTTKRPSNGVPLWLNTAAGFAAYNEIPPNGARVIRVDMDPPYAWALGNGSTPISGLTFMTSPQLTPDQSIVAQANRTDYAMVQGFPAYATKAQFLDTVSAMRSGMATLAEMEQGLEDYEVQTREWASSEFATHQAVHDTAVSHDRTWSTLPGKPSTFTPSSHTNGAGYITSASVPVQQRTTVTTNTSGVATWTFSTAFGSAPIVSALPVVADSNTSADVKITSISATSVTIQVNKITPVLGILTLLTSTNVGATVVHLSAIAP